MKNFKLDQLSLWKKIKNQDEDEEKKGKMIRIQMEGQRDREIRGFSFVFEIYNLYFSIFQDNYIVLLMDLSSINFDFSIFQE